MNQRRSLAILCLVLAIVFAVYTPSLQNGFAMDDRLVAMGTMDGSVRNPMVAELQPLGDYFAAHYWAGSQPASSLYRPVTVLSYAVRHHLFGDWPLPEHLANILLHLLGTCLVWWMLQRLGHGVRATALGATAFGLHAIHSEVVSAVVGRAELFAFVFGAAALWAWDSTRARRPPARIAGGAAAASLLFLAFCSKESSLVWLPFFAVFGAARHAATRGSRLPAADLLRLCGEAVLVGLAPLVLFLALRARMLAHLETDVTPIAHLVNQLAHLPAAERFPTAILVSGYALLLTLFPFRLAADYSTCVFATVGIADLRVLLVLAAFAALLAAAIRHRTRHPSLFVAAALFFGFAFPVSNLPIAIGTIFGERLYYTPSAAVAFAVAWLAARCDGRAFWLLLGGWLAVNAAVLWQRHAVWRDDATLFLHEVANQPDSVRMHTAAAQQYSDRGARSLSLYHLQQARRLDPENALVWNNLGALHLDAGELEAAEACALRGLDAEHHCGSEDLYKLHCNLALVHAAKQRFDSAVQHVEATLGHRPGFIRAYRELRGWEAAGRIPAGTTTAVLDRVAARHRATRPYVDVYRGLELFRAGRADAAQQLATGIAALPASEDRASWHHEVGVDLIALGRSAAAVQSLQAALAREPGRVAAFRELARLTGAGSLPLAELRRFLAAQPAAPAFALYQALADLQEGMLRGDRELQQRARDGLEAVLPRLPRWRHRGVLVGEAREQLVDLHRVLGDEAAARTHLRALASDPALPEATREAAKTALEQQ